jgi:kinesin family protein 2/24
LEEEEDLISEHRHHIDDMVDLVRDEMMLLHEVDKPGSDVEEYVKNLDKILCQKIELISGVRSKLITFHTHLKEEETLSKEFYEQSQLEEGNEMDTS